MKRLLSLLIIIISFQSASYASHTYGGEIGWVCLPNGKYIFTMSFFRDCSGIQWTFRDETISIVGSPLPKDATGATISSILMSPDSARWEAERQGDSAPYCTDQYGSPLSCGNGDNGIIQEFWYTSSPLTLSGTPPRNGWRFYWVSACCRPGNIVNIDLASTGGTPSTVLRAEMLPTKNGDDVDPCIDSSPDFRALPVSAICRGYEFTYNTTAIDDDLDSVTYDFSTAVNPPIIAPNVVQYKSGYNFNNPTPDKSFDIRNIPSTLNRTAGTVNMAIYSGGGVAKYLTVIRATEWRDGVPIGRIYRELPISVFDCPPLPSGFTNQPPSILIEGEDASTVQITAVAGQEVRRSIEIKDLDQTGVGSQLQVVTLVPDGLMFTSTRQFGSKCQTSNPLIEPCAYLRKQNPFLDKTEDPPVYKVQGLGGVSSEFVWQTSCPHVQTKTGVPGTRSGIYNFVMRVTDDHCPIPSINYPTISVKVTDPKILSEPIVKGLSVGLDGKITYQWASPLDSANTFEKYIVEYAITQEGFQPTIWSEIKNNLKTYHYTEKYPDDPAVYLPIGNIAGNPSDLFRVNKGQLGNGFDWYLRMTTVSGCEDTSRSIASEPVRVIELETAPEKVAPAAPLKGAAKLTWNRAKPLNATTKPYFKYESPTWYYIWENDSVGKAGAQRAETEDESNWYLRGRTDDIEYVATSNVCGEFVGFRVEARDTIITWLQGHSFEATLSADSLDTLIFSTFSTVDTLYQVQAGFIPEPNFDTLQVLDNGDVYVRVDVANAGTIGEFEIYEDNIVVGNDIITLEKAIQDSAYLVGAGATAGTAVDHPNTGVIGTVNTYIMRAIDDCDASKTNDGPKYTTLSPYGELSSPCPPTFTLNWNKPLGFPVISAYKIYMNGELHSSITDENTTTIDLPVAKGESYRFHVEAIMNRTGKLPAVNISPGLNYNVPANLRSDIVVDGPDLRCTQVNIDGSVTITFEHPYDTTDNRTAYEWQYKTSASGSWNDFTPAIPVDVFNDSTVDITGINAQVEGFDFRARTLSGCSRFEAGDYSSSISSIFLTATPRPGDRRKWGDIEWNNDAVATGNENTVHRNGVDQPNRYNEDPKVRGTFTSWIDNTNGKICDTTYFYYLTRPVNLLSAAPGQTCLSRSNVSEAWYNDSIKPIAENFDYITFNLNTQEIEAVWTESEAGLEDGDVEYLRIQTTAGFNSGLPQYRLIDSTEWDLRVKQVSIPISELDARDSSIALGSRSVDACDNVSDMDSVIFHRSMDIRVRWSICDSTMNLSWNPYVGFPEGEKVFYQVFVSTSGQTEIDFENGDLPGIGVDTTYVHKITQGEQRYYFHVKASLDSTNFLGGPYISNSNVESEMAAYDAEPRYGEVTYVSVLPTDQIEVEYYKDTLVAVNGYIVYRGTALNDMRPIVFEDYLPIEDAETFRYIDSDVDVNSGSYYYHVVIENDCRVPIDTSNFGKSIFLQVTSDNEGLKNTLKWNRYEEWDSTVAYYNIYRGVDGEPTENVYAVVAPTGRRTEVFVDDVYDDIFAIGKFCYRVEAVQGPVSDEITAGLTNNIQPATSTSNKSCTNLKPLFYVPNAFAPDGVNQVFGPKGQFFDFSLYEMVIYNRWGEEVYRTRDINKGWDGTHNGEKAQVGTYVYMIRFVDTEGNDHRRKGTVTLLK